MCGASNLVIKQFFLKHQYSQYFSKHSAINQYFINKFFVIFEIENEKVNHHLKQAVLEDSEYAR